jgi:uncharacterized protein YcfJ
MRRTLMIAGLAALVAAPSLASAESCQQRAHDRRVTGTVVGGVGGALIGQAISHDTAGTLLGGVGGAVVGNQVARTNCYDAPRAYDHSRTRYSHSREAPRGYGDANAAGGGCHYENRPYYDERGQLVYAPTQVCR